MGASAFAPGAYLCREDPSWHQLFKNAVNAGIFLCRFASYVARVPADQNSLFTPRPVLVGLVARAIGGLLQPAGASRCFRRLEPAQPPPRRGSRRTLFGMAEVPDSGVAAASRLARPVLLYSGG
jgi:hypothetical protein